MQHIPRSSLVGVIFLLTALLTRLVAADARLAELEKLGGMAFDTEFLTRMVRHHNHGISLAQTAAQYAQREDLRHFAAEVIVTQMKEVKELETLRTGSEAGPGGSAADELLRQGRMTFPVGDESTVTEETAIEPIVSPPTPRMVETSPAAGSPEDRAQRATLARLAASRRFDEDFLREMSAHYAEGLSLADLARQKSSARAVKDLASTLAQGQSRELAELKRLERAR